eukprot:4125345-Pyramimonas_sp.AAC.1
MMLKVVRCAVDGGSSSCRGRERSLELNSTGQAAAVPRSASGQDAFIKRRGEADNALVCARRRCEGLVHRVFDPGTANPADYAEGLATFLCKFAVREEVQRIQRSRQNQLA